MHKNNFLYNQPTHRPTIHPKNQHRVLKMKRFFSQLTKGGWKTKKQQQQQKPTTLTRRTSCKENPHFHDVGYRLRMGLALSEALSHLSRAVSVSMPFHLLLHQRTAPTSVSKHLCQPPQIINRCCKFMDPGFYSDFHLDRTKDIWSLCMCSFHFYMEYIALSGEGGERDRDRDTDREGHRERKEQATEDGI